METKRQIIAIARHGKTPLGEEGQSLDSLTDASVQNMYNQSTRFQDDFGINPQKVFVLHSDKDRTITTAQARLAGIRRLTPAPLTQSDLRTFQFNGTLFIRDDRLSYENLKVNEGAVKALGLDGYIEWILAHRQETEIGCPITSFDQLYATRKPVLGDAVRRLDAGKYDLGFISTHAMIADAILIAAADSARPQPVSQYEEVGDQFEKEDIAYLVIDAKKSGTSEAKIIRGELTLPANIDRIRTY